jgi:hypothetical protein
MAARVTRGSAPVLQRTASNPSGQPLDAATRGFMESRLGHDFSGVRVHADAQAGRSARELNALAFTTGNDIAFGPGQYAPHSNAGRHLLAHELTHVVQQRSHGPSIQRKTAEKAPCAVHAYDNSNPLDAAIVPKDGSGIGVSSVADMVSKVNAFVDKPENNCSCVKQLDINGHGMGGRQRVGSGLAHPFDPGTVLSHDSSEAHLRQMASIKFCPTGMLRLLGCHVGQGTGKDLLHRLSAILPGKLIGGAKHFTSPVMAGGPVVVGGNDLLTPEGNVTKAISDPYNKSPFVRWHITIGDKEYVINGEEAETPENQAKLKAGEKVKVKTPDGKLKTIK